MEADSSGITVVGSANMDVIGHVPHLPTPGETVLGTWLTHSPGGKGANQAVAAARAGSSVAFVGRVGADAYGEGLLDSLRNAGVTTDHLHVDREQPTGVALIMVDEGGNNMIGVLPGANGNVSPADVDRAREYIATGKVLLMQLEIPLQTVAHAVHLGVEAGCTSILNPAPARALDPSLLGMFDVIVPNEAEVGRLAGIGSPVEPATAARLLLDTGVKAVVVTLGDRGAVVVTPTQEVSISPYLARPVDTTGAGDAFVGNLAHALAQGSPLVEAAQFASAAASLSVQRPGAQPSMPRLDETRRLIGDQA